MHGSIAELLEAEAQLFTAQRTRRAVGRCCPRTTRGARPWRAGPGEPRAQNVTPWPCGAATTGVPRRTRRTGP
ncbi:hypothetical protein QJS66_05580 [Kocuria rhizophila]|nr:hypothetical protein QJS66_05580 [Kocuria rhizophila]